MKVLFSNSFHKTEKIISIKDSYKDGIDNLFIELQASADCNGDSYAKRKLAEIKRGLCGCPSCGCMTMTRAVKI